SFRTSRLMWITFFFRFRKIIRSLHSPNFVNGFCKPRSNSTPGGHGGPPLQYVSKRPLQRGLLIEASTKLSNSFGRKAVCSEKNTFDPRDCFDRTGFTNRDKNPDTRTQRRAGPPKPYGLTTGVRWGGPD